VDRLASAVLEPGLLVPVTALLAIARAPHAPTERNALLELAAARARLDGLRGEQIEALLELCADPAQRNAVVLTELDRLTRGGGSAGLHPRLVDWLEAARERFPELGVLSLRRRAELCARKGEAEVARSIADRALALAEASRDPVGVALAYSTAGAVALYRADWEFAERALEHARRTIAAGAVDDAEEIARIHHNFGVVALYRGRLEAAAAAFTQSLEAKRALGDRAGVWACLLNLGLARCQLGDLDAAEYALNEATALCRSLSQLSGLGWCLAAQAEVALRRGDAAQAEKCISDGEHLGESLPVPVRADLVLLRSELALLEGDARRALSELANLSADTRTDDTAVDLRACVLEAKAAMVQLPADRKRALRLALSVIRRARKIELAEPERRAWALVRDVRKARKTAAKQRPVQVRYDDDVGVDAIFQWLGSVGQGARAGDAAVALARLLCDASGAERAFLVLLDDGDRVVQAVGVDLDGLPIAEPEVRAGPAIVGVRGISHVPVLDTAGGRGSRLAATLDVPNGRAGFLLEHRFVTGCFDAVSEDLAARWLSLAAVCMRLTQDASSREATAEHRPPVLAVPTASVTLREVTAEPSTVLPMRQRQRKYPSLIGESPAFERALDRLDAAVDSDLPVLISGETGVGKELFARALHDMGTRSRAHFVAINCGAIPDALFEAELFGHARGSFTGADRARQGLLSRAEGGTLFLDEIGELPLVRQAALLRALATRTYRPVGSDSERPFDVRIIAASNRDLEQEVESGGFRRDLLYRIQVLHIAVPPLRDRDRDAILIARHVLRSAGVDVPIDKDAAAALCAYRWPGNVRQLEHQIQRIAATGPDMVALEHLSREVRGAKRPKKKSRAAVGSSEERQQVEQALRAAEGNITRAARKLSMTRQGLKKKMARLGMRTPADVQMAAVRATPGGQK
jgi:DNA-binding NtrC family response regulator/Tfp pilus assembly protein PilF